MNKHYQKILFRVISVFLSTLLWFYVFLSEDHLIKRNVAIHFKLPADKAMSSVNTNRVMVEYTGPRAFLASFSKSGISPLVVDLTIPSFLGKDSLEYVLSKDLFPKSFKIDVKSISPKILKISTDRKINKMVPIYVESFSGVGDDFKLVSKDFFPKKVKISGPIGLMRKVGQIKIPSIDLSGVNDKGVLDINLPVVDPFISYDDNKQIKVSYEIRPKKANIFLKNVPVKFLSSNQGFRPMRRQVNVELLAGEGMNVEQSDILIIAEIPEGAKGLTKIKLDAKLPDGIHLLQISPETINVRVR